MQTRTRGHAASRLAAAVDGAGQIALSLVLLVGALLFVRSFRNLTTVETGLRQDGVMFANVARLTAQRPTAEQILALERSVIEQIRSIPHVEAAAATSQFPLNGSSWTKGVLVPDESGPKRRSSKFTYVSPGTIQHSASRSAQGAMLPMATRRLRAKWRWSTDVHSAVRVGADPLRRHRAHDCRAWLSGVDLRSSRRGRATRSTPGADKCRRSPMYRSLNIPTCGRSLAW